MTSTLPAYLKQVRQLSPELQKRECGLIALGKKHAEDFDAGHAPSGGQLHRVLADLRRLAVAEAKAASQPQTPAPPVRSELDEIRKRRAARLADTTGAGAPS